MQTDKDAVKMFTDSSPSYDFVIDPDTDSTHANVIRMVGSSRRVLELGPATGYMTDVLRANDCSVVGIEIDADMAAHAAQFCERTIVGDLDTMDLDAELNGDQFDVIVAADVLEHLKDPLRALQSLSAFLRPEGYFVVSLPNVAHASVRLALLEGRFAYQELGLLDSTHLRFFTRESMEKMFDEAELAIVEMHRQELEIQASEVSFDTSVIPDTLMDVLRHDVDARTYQFIFKALPVGRAGLSHIQERMRSMAREHTDLQLALERERTDLQQALAVRESEHVELRDALAAITAREGDIRMALIDAHDLALLRDEELRQIGDRLKLEEEKLAEVSRAHTEVSRAHTEVWRVHNEAKEIILARDRELELLRVRLGRISGSLPVRAWHSVSGLPPLRWVRARRVAAYNAALQHPEDVDGR